MARLRARIIVEEFQSAISKIAPLLEKTGKLTFVEVRNIYPAIKL